MALAMSSDGRCLAVARAGACVANVHLAPEVSVWDMASGSCRHTLLHGPGQHKVCPGCPLERDPSQACPGAGVAY